MLLLFWKSTEAPFVPVIQAGGGGSLKRRKKKRHEFGKLIEGKLHPVKFPSLPTVEAFSEKKRSSEEEDLILAFLYDE